MDIPDRPSSDIERNRSIEQLRVSHHPVDFILEQLDNVRTVLVGQYDTVLCEA